MFEVFISVAMRLMEQTVTPLKGKVNVTSREAVAVSPVTVGHCAAVNIGMHTS